VGKPVDTAYCLAARLREMKALALGSKSNTMWHRLVLDWRVVMLSKAQVGISLTKSLRTRGPGSDPG
jgi:hypothetical protein